MLSAVKLELPSSSLNIELFSQNWTISRQSGPDIVWSCEKKNGYGVFPFEARNTQQEIWVLPGWSDANVPTVASWCGHYGAQCHSFTFLWWLLHWPQWKSTNIVHSSVPSGLSSSGFGLRYQAVRKSQTQRLVSSKFSGQFTPGLNQTLHRLCTLESAGWSLFTIPSGQLRHRC